MDGTLKHLFITLHLTEKIVMIIWQYVGWVWLIYMCVWFSLSICINMKGWLVTATSMLGWVGQGCAGLGLAGLGGLDWVELAWAKTGMG